MTLPMNPPVQRAIDQIRATFVDYALDIDADGQGGAFVRVNGLVFGPAFSPNVGWIAFHIVFNTPHADVYPHYLPPEFKRADDKPLGEGFQKKEMKLGRFTGPATMVSRRSKRWTPAHDTAALKLLKVLDWIRA